MKRLYIFDLDGTLVNSIEDLADSVNIVLKNHGFKVHDTDKYKFFVGNGTLKLVERALPESEKDEVKVKKYHDEFSKIYAEKCMIKTHAYNGIKEVLNELKLQGNLLAVASNKPDEFSKKIVETIFGKGFFDEISGKKEGVPKKPEPDIVKNIMKKLNVDNKNAIMIGDSAVDVKTAHNSCMKCVGCSWGFRGYDELKKAGADFIINEPKEILNIKSEEIKMNDFYKRFVDEGFDENGILNKFELKLPENFNFSYDVIDEIAKIEPNKIILHWINEAGDERIFTAKEMSELSNQAANMLTAHGVKKGDMVMAVLKRHYEFWILAYGLMKIGAVMIPATCQLMKKDYTYRFKAASVSYIAATYESQVTEHIDEALKEYDGMKEKFITHGKKDGWTDFMSEIEKFPKTFERIETHVEEPMLAYFSSGTTGYPKMVLHRYSLAAGHIITAKHWQHLDENSVHLTVSETGWAKCAWGKMYGQIACGAVVFVYDFDRFNPDKLLKVLESNDITSFCAPPTMYRFFIKSGLENYDLSHLKYSCVAGEALNPEVYNKWKEYTGLKLMEGFGQTETAVVLGNLYGMTPKPGSMGKPSPLYNVDLVDSEGNRVADNVTGEIVIRAERGKHPSLFKEYYRNKELTDKAWEGGVYHTGDTAYRDEDGYYWYVGRTDDLIKASGYRIGPFEIESVLMEHPSVLECAVTAADDPIRGKVVKATIVLANGYKASDELAKELQNYVKKSTAPYKYPRIVEFVEELPKTISGKIRRVEIRENDKKKNNK